MTPRNKINIILLFVVAILVAILVFDTDKPTAVTFKLSPLSEDSINEITITRLTSETVKLNKINNQWFMTSPYKVRANTFYIESLLQIAKAESQSQFDIDNKDKNKFKLNPPQATLKLNNQLFSFGTNEQLHLNRYILTNKKLYLLPDRYFYLLNIATTGYMDHALINKHDKIIKLKLTNLVIELENDKWQVTPEPENNSSDDIVQLISEWNNSQVVEIKKLSDKREKKDFSIEVKLDNKLPAIVFDVILKEDTYLFIRPDLKLQYTLNQDMANRLLKIPNQKIESQ